MSQRERLLTNLWKRVNKIPQKKEIAIQVSKNLDIFCQEKFGGNRSALARFLKTSPQNVDRWCSSTEMPAWSLIKIFEAFPDAPSFFLRGETEGGTVAEEEDEWQKNDPRMELIKLIKEFVRDPEADEEAIQALLSNVKVFRRKVGKQK